MDLNLSVRNALYLATDKPGQRGLTPTPQEVAEFIAQLGEAGYHLVVINDATLRAVSAAADMADSATDQHQGPAEPYIWHRAFLAELGEAGYRVVATNEVSS